MNKNMKEKIDVILNEEDKKVDNIEVIEEEADEELNSDDDISGRLIRL